MAHPHAAGAIRRVCGVAARACTTLARARVRAQVSWLMGEWSQLAPAVSERLGLRGGRQLSAYEVDALWTLCQVEAGLQVRRRHRLP